VNRGSGCWPGRRVAQTAGHRAAGQRSVQTTETAIDASVPGTGAPNTSCYLNASTETQHNRAGSASSAPPTGNAKYATKGQGPRHGQREGTVLPRSGEVLRVTKSASVQFSEPMMFRVIRVHDWQTSDGWAWLDGYQLNAIGDAVERRSIFVQLKGL